MVGPALHRLPTAGPAATTNTSTALGEVRRCPARRRCSRHRLRAACAVHGERRQFRTRAPAVRPARHPGRPAPAMRPRRKCSRSVEKLGQRPIARIDRPGPVQRPPDRGAHDPSPPRPRSTCAPNAGHGVVHCPESNLSWPSGSARWRTVNAGIQRRHSGTDGRASNNDLDMVGGLRTITLLAKGFATPPVDTTKPLGCAARGRRSAMGF